ncbi:DUF1641 domain-containing protein [Pantoea ananatis]|uniref:DUF1641 domain-containing protein n=1 Tax=Pantoea ananas TaxID=553 RepID=UPI001C89F813|nr:DUF1641 domain-containing protein [Pantoea ananatis]QZE31354.1 DUF1641 domain-containing protein [Pantoea ananatis]
MAEPLKYDVPPARTEPTANEALATLLESLHQHGFLRLATDLVNANTQIAGVLVNGLNQPGALNAVQNLSLIFKALATIPPEEFNPVLLGMVNAAKAMRASGTGAEEKTRPGIRGIIRLLNDEELWRGITPALAGVRAFGHEMKQPSEKPISRYSSKKSHA